MWKVKWGMESCSSNTDNVRWPAFHGTVVTTPSFDSVGLCSNGDGWRAANPPVHQPYSGWSINWYQEKPRKAHCPVPSNEFLPTTGSKTWECWGQAHLQGKSNFLSSLELAKITEKYSWPLTSSPSRHFPSFLVYNESPVKPLCMIAKLHY